MTTSISGFLEQGGKLASGAAGWALSHTQVLQWGAVGALVALMAWKWYRQLGNIRLLIHAGETAAEWVSLPMPKSKTFRYQGHEYFTPKKWGLSVEGFWGNKPFAEYNMGDPNPLTLSESGLMGSLSSDEQAKINDGEQVKIVATARTSTRDLWLGVIAGAGGCALLIMAAASFKYVTFGKCPTP